MSDRIIDKDQHREMALNRAHSPEFSVDTVANPEQRKFVTIQGSDYPIEHRGFVGGLPTRTTPMRRADCPFREGGAASRRAWIPRGSGLVRQSLRGHSHQWDAAAG